MDFVDYWDTTHKKHSDESITYDNWLDKYQCILHNCSTNVLDLGCGTGNDTLYLVERGFKVIACDYSKVALDILKKNISSAETKLIDISGPLPFNDSSFDVIVADLSLHYFDDETTKKIMKEIRRILSPNGYLLARVNSTKDTNFGAGQGVKLDQNYYYVDGYNKRFFTIEDAINYFSLIGECQVVEADMNRYEKPKKVLEISATKK
ncbi:MAG: class I SAM-dependent methyltransferase [Coprobacillus sp.]|nr:class I SAM-dependent methyltransferase [Coprobacillus sp.]